MDVNYKKEVEEATNMEELIPASTSDSPRKPIKSTAVVKYAAVEAPACFEKLRYNTDLNQPPSNWLSPKTCGGIHHGLSNNSGFSSFRMAHMFPDCVGEVDVVSDAENIKKLLKIPYSKGPVSMMVHRVENTLLIDEFDVHKHLLRTAEWDWRWLRTFFFDHVLTSLRCRDQGLYQKGSSRGVLQQRSLVSKFLYHSIAEAGGLSQEEGESAAPSTPEPPSTTPGMPPNWEALPEPCVELPDTKSNHEFARNVKWTFEDIQMLIGTDMPIFGGSTHPCISLRLRDMNKPISVLTGIDYWLDNLMCNVPEVVMCYHLDGIVQKYELVKTEDLPHLEDSKFSPKLIHDVAQNILSFLKSNATKAGHTYWLFKGKDDDAVKLYDLTSLCGDDIEEKGQNPFTVPVAMLLYRVARNMKQQGSAQLGCIRILLQNCLELLDKEKYPQIVTSAHYMLADLYVPAETDPSSPQLPEDQPESEGEEEDEEREEQRVGSLETTGETSVAALACRPLMSYGQKTQIPPLCGDTRERCLQALEHVRTGLNCLRLLDTRMWHQEETPAPSEDGPQMAQPHRPIPMPYTPIGKDTLAVTVQQGGGEVVQGGQTVKTGHLLTLLYEKAALVLAVLVQDSLNVEAFGRALSEAKAALKLLSGLDKLAELLGVQRNPLDAAGVAEVRVLLLGQAGDACSLLVQRWSSVERHQAEFTAGLEDVKEILQHLEMDVGTLTEGELCCGGLDSMQRTLLAAAQAYSQALELHPASEQASSLRRRLGNSHNELGVLYMNQATAKHSEGALLEFERLVQLSFHELEAGTVAFESVSDSFNLALLLCNTGRLMRLRAHALVPATGTPLGPAERTLYLKAVGYYQRALSTLGPRRTPATAGIWDSVTWELSTTLFNMAATLQDFPNCLSKSQEELEREVGEALQRALQSCDLDTPGARLPIYQFRAATLHHRLASLHHKSYRLQSSGEEPKRKFSLQLCKIHYEKAADMFRILEEAIELLRVQLERVALAEFVAEGSSSTNTRRKSLHSALELLVRSEAEIRALGAPSETEEESGRLLRLAEQRLQCLLLALTKLTSQQPPKPAKSKESSGLNFRAMYALTLHRVQGSEDVPTLARRLADQLLQIGQLLHKS